MAVTIIYSNEYKCETAAMTFGRTVARRNRFTLFPSNVLNDQCRANDKCPDNDKRVLVVGLSYSLFVGRTINTAAILAFEQLENKSAQAHDRSDTFLQLCC